MLELDRIRRIGSLRPYFRKEILFRPSEHGSDGVYKAFAWLPCQTQSKKIVWLDFFVCVHQWVPAPYGHTFAKKLFVYNYTPQEYIRVKLSNEHI